MMGATTTTINDEESPPRVEQAAATTTAAADLESNATTVSNIFKDQSSLAYVGIIVSAIVVLIALTSDKRDLSGHKYYKYGISVASIAMILSVVGWLLTFKRDILKEGQEKVLIYLNYFLFAWCFIGACFLTFGGPFETTGNGYFGSWGLAMFATMALGITAASLTQTANTAGPLAGLFASAVVLLVAISSEGIHKNDKFFPELVYSLVVTLLTIIVAGLMLKGMLTLDTHAKLGVLAVFAIFWIVVACLVTFRGPFTETGNGYFGAWGGAVTSVFAVNAARRESQAGES